MTTNMLMTNAVLAALTDPSSYTMPKSVINSQNSLYLGRRRRGREGEKEGEKEKRERRKEGEKERRREGEKERRREGEKERGVFLRSYSREERLNIIYAPGWRSSSILATSLIGLRYLRW